ncbi:hypothetical protein VPHD479_0114 [Vibrio phage D479]
MKTEMISTMVGMMSCVGFSSEFPWKRGNYCFVGRGGSEIYLANLWAENLEYMVDHDILDGKMEAILFGDGPCKVALVVDKRIPEGVLHKPYFCGVATNVELLRYYYNIPEDKCCCEFDVDLVSWTRRSYVSPQFKAGACPQCKTEYKVPMK